MCVSVPMPLSRLSQSAIADYETTAVSFSNHQRIVTYYGTERTPEYLAIFMEYVPGVSRVSIVGGHGDAVAFAEPHECTFPFKSITPSII